MNQTIDITSATDAIMAALDHEFAKIQRNISEENGKVEVSFISVGDMSNRVLMAIDREMRKAKIYSFPLYGHGKVRPSVQMIVAAALTDRQAPRVAETRPLVQVMVAAVFGDHAAIMALEDAL